MRRIALFALLLVLATAGTASAKWRQIQGPILTPTLPWEASAVQEPTVIWDHDRYRLWYTGGWDHCYLGYAESLDGIHWAKWPKPRLDHACHSSVVKTSRGYMVFSTPEDGASLQVTHSRDGIHFPHPSPQYTIMRLDPDGWDNEFISNTYAYKRGRTWRLMYEARSPGWQVGVTTLGLSGPTKHAKGHLSLGLGGMAGGPWRDGRCLYFHASPSAAEMLLPTAIYRRCGPLDGLGPIEPALGREQSWEYDQVADPSIARRPGHRPLMLFSGMDNPHAGGKIGAAFEVN